MEDHKRTQEIAIKHLGHMGAFLSGSKRAPEGFVVVWNANVVIFHKGETIKIWYGDINISVSEGKIRALSEELEKNVYILREHDCRFETENSPNLRKAVYVHNTDGSIENVAAT